MMMIESRHCPVIDDTSPYERTMIKFYTNSNICLDRYSLLNYIERNELIRSTYPK